MKAKITNIITLLIALIVPNAIMRTGNIYVFVSCLAYILFIFFYYSKLYIALAKSERKSVEAAASRKIMFVATSVMLVYLIWIICVLVLTYSFWSTYIRF